MQWPSLCIEPGFGEEALEPIANWPEMLPSVPWKAEPAIR
jgi:hypothetical protein